MVVTQRGGCPPSGRCGTDARLAMPSAVPGSASPADAVPSTTTSANVFGTMNACQVLDQLLAGQGFDPGQNKSARNQCTASKLEFGTYGLTFDQSQNLADFAASNPGATQTAVNGRNAMQALPTPGMCVYALEVGQNARATAGVNMAYPKDNAKACPNAKQLAERLEALLPKDQ